MTHFRILRITALLLLCAGPAFADAWTDWSGGFDASMTECAAAAGNDCLAKAFAAHPRPALDSTDVAGDLTRDLRTADVLLHRKDARDQLWRLFGIDGAAYLGTGYSVPLAGPGARDYDYATQREFFVPNLCAEAADKDLCPEAVADVWTWRLTSAELTHWVDKPIAELLRLHHPVHDAKGFAKLAAHHAEKDDGNIPPLLIRFGSLPLAYYKGTFGRPDAVRVFFADYGQVRAKTLRGAMTATGASTLLESPDPAKTNFIWIYAPKDDPRTAVASWKALFRILGAP